MHLMATALAKKTIITLAVQHGKKKQTIHHALVNKETKY